MAPVPSLVDEYIHSNAVMIFSKTTCPYCTRVKGLFDTLGVTYLALELDTVENGDILHKALAAKVGRTSVPQVFIKGRHMGGCDDVMNLHNSGKLSGFLEDQKYDYDLVVIGGGSGGLAASKEAARLGKKVAVLDFVVPTPIGTSWGLGGTCVNVGCIPKKLMHQAALHGQGIKDSKHYGWKYDESALSHDWNAMKDSVQAHIKSLNWNYKVQLRSENVTYINAFGEFIDNHQIKAIDKKGKEKLITSNEFLIATGERPRYPDIPGAKEFGITSDDLFSLPSSPGKTLVIGASYVALECAGFLFGIGLDVTVMVRSIFLRGFDQDMAERIGKHMVSEGIKIIRPCVPEKIEKMDSNEHKLRVTARMQTGEEMSEDYDTVLFAIGRDSCTDKIGLEKVQVTVNKNGKIPTVNEQTNVPNIYAIGDVLDGKPELTPVAIEAGILLARRLFNGGNTQCDYTFVPTTVFTPLEYGAIGFSEEKAIETYGESNLEVYHSSLTPLEWTVTEREKNECYAKIICLIPENERIIGFHYLGPNAGEVTQGFALGIKLGATKADLDRTIGIHPTCAEIFTTLKITKRSQQSTDQAGC